MAARLANEQTSEIQALASYLLQTYTNKTFILSNWEMDNAISYTSAKLDRPISPTFSRTSNSSPKCAGAR